MPDLCLHPSALSRSTPTYTQPGTVSEGPAGFAEGHFLGFCAIPAATDLKASRHASATGTSNWSGNLALLNVLSASCHQTKNPFEASELLHGPAESSTKQIFSVTDWSSLKGAPEAGKTKQILSHHPREINC